MKSKNIPTKVSYDLWFYFVLAFAWSWAFWIPAAYFKLDVRQFSAQLLFGLGGLGPPLSGVLFTYRAVGKKGLRDYFRRIWDWRNLNLFWWAMALFTVPALTWVAGEIDQLLGGKGNHFSPDAFHFASSMPLALAIPAIIVFYLFFGPIPEEMGWRGYALDRLQERMGPWMGSLLLGLFWGAWHLPLFYLGGSFQNTLAVGTPGFWLFFGGVLSVSLIMTWIYNRTGKSILSAILFHFACNMTGETMVHYNRIEFLRVLLCLLWVLVVAVWGKDRDLGYQVKKKA
jgi:uncharacterized protein